MKRILFILLAASVLAVSCAKVSVNSTSAQREISFVTATAGMSKAGIEGTVFPTTETFGAYAWSSSSLGAYFMDNEKVSYNATTSEWKPSSTYYWPKNATVDFTCYYPYNMSGVTIEPSKISYSGIDVEAGQTDIMYGDKAVGYSDNVDEATDGTNSYTGVPVVFHHALAKVRVIIELAYNHKKEDDGTVTDWEVSINGASIDNFYKAGNCQLSLAADPSTGIVPWDKPKDADGNFVWTADGSTTSISGSASSISITPGNQYELISEFFVLPQALVPGKQSVSVNMSVKTIRNGSPFLYETFTKSADLYLLSLPAWNMNQITTYKLVVAPAAGAGNGGNPGTPVDPNNPDLSDAVITFDPSVDGWDNVGVITTINI